MKLTIIGSATAAPDPERVCSAYAVETAGQQILLDCGPGAVHHLARFGAPWADLTHVAITHFHTDHVGGLPFLFFALEHGLAVPRTDLLTVVGPHGTTALFRRMADAFGDHLLEPGFPVVIRELASGELLPLDGGVLVRAHTTPHTSASIAYRIDAPEGALGYTGDTGPSDALGDFFQGVDTLLAECSLPETHAIDTHLTPSRVTELARRARPRRLLLTHIYPQLDPGQLPARILEAGWEGPVHVVRDGMRFSI